MQRIRYILVLWLTVTASTSYADVTMAQQLAEKYATAAKVVDPSYTGLSATAGKVFFNREQLGFKGDSKNTGKPVACASCHTTNPADPGLHIVTNKPIKPLSPVINPKRFNSIKNVEIKFTKHCNEVLGNDCTLQEKGDYIAYLLTEATPTKK
jgi:hypothetical protein